MIKLRLVLLATTTLTAMQFASSASHAQTAPIVVAQAQPEPGHEKEPPKGAPPKGAPPKGAPPPHAAPPAAAPPRPAPPAAAPPRPAPPAAAPTPPRPPAPPRPAPPAAAPPPRPTPPAAPPPRAQPEVPRPAPPAAAPPPTAPKPPVTPNAAPAVQPHERERTAPGPATPPAGTPPAIPPGGARTPPAPSPTPQTQTAPSAAPNVRTAPANTTAPNAAPAAQPNAAQAPNAPAGQAGRPPGAPGAPAGAPFARRAPPSAAPLPAAPVRAQALTPIAPGAAVQGPRRMDDFRSERHEVQEGGRTVITEPGRVIVRDPGGQSFIRHDEDQRFRFGARDIQTQRVGSETRTIVIRPDGSQIITVVGADGQLLRRIRRDQQGREIIIIDNSYRDPRAVGGFYVDLPPPVISIPYDRYIVDADDASPDLIYDTMEAPPVDRLERRYTLDEIRYSPGVRLLMPSIDLNSINFETGSWEIPPDQAAKLQVIADGLNRAIQRNPREVFLIEGHTDAVGNDVDNLSLSDRRAESAAELLTQQYGVPAENLTSQGYGSQYLKEQTDGPSRINRRVTVRRITPLLNGGTASLPPPPPGIAPPR
ncbi:OmpA family protein [Bradyrhizobium canariense]|nr:OmpA family protein [Bradyrhizobium canariense]